MKRLFPFAVLLLIAALTACTPKQRTLVILSTNDIHSHIENFPRLASAVERCRDTVPVILVDAGDRWPGNSYVDMVEGRTPILELMNRLGYDLATLGNHEFDLGQEQLERAVAYCDFPIICANIQCGEGALLKPFEPSRIISRGGVKVGFYAAVTSYGPNNHPNGNDFAYVGLTFPDAVETVAAGAASLKGRCDVLAALTHFGLKKDRQLAGLCPDYDLIIGGHSHDEANEVTNGVLITQSGYYLRNVGVTTIRMRDGRVEGISYRVVPLKNYEPHPLYEQMLETYYSNPELSRPVGELAAPADWLGLANLLAESVRRAGEAEIGIYHQGGVRRDTLAAGPVPIAAIYDVDPFHSKVSTALMTPAQLRRLIIAKFNDKDDPSEAHCIDLYATTPYTVVTDSLFNAVDVRFPELEENKAYRVAMGDYVFANYSGLECEQGVTLDSLVTDCVQTTLAAGPYTPCNRSRQNIE